MWSGYLLVIVRNASDGGEVTHFKILEITSGRLFKHDGTTEISNGEFITVAEGSAGLKFTPAANLSSPTTQFGFIAQAALSDADTGLGGIPALATITVNPAAEVPSVTSAQSVNNWATAISTGPPNESDQTVNFQVTGNTNTALFAKLPAITSSGTLTYTSAANAQGSATITIVLKDNGGTAFSGQDTSVPQTFNITVNAANSAPSFVKGADQTVNEDSGAQTVASWATAISPGPANESSQTVSFKITNNNNSLFSAQPAVGATGTLTYTPAANANGTATVSVSISDDGGTANGGVDTSATQTFTITVNAVNDAPSFTRGADQTIQDPNPQAISGWATNISTGPADEAGQAITFLVTNDNNVIFSEQPGISASGTLTYTRASTFSGIATVTVRLMDSGGTALGGTDTSASQTFTVTNMAPAILTVEGTDRAVGLDSVTFLRDPLPILGDFNFSPDRRTRVILFALNTQLEPGENTSAVTAEAEVSGTVFPLIVDFVSPVPNFDWLTQVVIKFPEQFLTGTTGTVDVKVRIRLRGVNSNQAVITIVPAPAL